MDGLSSERNGAGDGWYGIAGGRNPWARKGDLWHIVRYRMDDLYQREIGKGMDYF